MYIRSMDRTTPHASNIALRWLQKQSCILKVGRETLHPCSIHFPKVTPLNFCSMGTRREAFTRSSWDSPRCDGSHQTRDSNDSLWNMSKKIRKKWATRLICINHENRWQLDYAPYWSYPTPPDHWATCQTNFHWRRPKMVQLLFVWLEKLVKYKQTKCGTLFWITL